MPYLILAPIAAGLAWLALRFGTGEERRRRAEADAAASAGDALAAGSSRMLEPEEDPWKLERLKPADRAYGLSSTGGEVGGPYGPEQNDQAPSGEAYDGSAPAATETYLMEPAPDYLAPWAPTVQANIATYPTSVGGYPTIPDPTQGVVPYSGGPAPAPQQEPRYLETTTSGEQVFAVSGGRVVG